MKSLSKKENDVNKLKVIMLRLEEFLESKYDFRYNTLDNRYEYRLKDSENDFQVICERDINQITLEAMKANTGCLDRDVYRYIHSKSVKDYHPVREYVNALPEWDRRDRVTFVAERINHNRTWVAHFHRWMLGMVAQWMGIDMRYGNCLMPILISTRQGLKKSTFCECLLPPVLRKYYLDDFDIHSRSNVDSKLAKFALINVDEIYRFSKQKMERLKNILQMASVKMKKSGSSEYEALPRLASFIATTNYREVITDPTGSRRELPAELETRIRNLSINYLQLYAQLKHELLHKRRYWLTPAEERRLVVHNKAYTRRPVEESVFFECFRLPQEGEKADHLSLTQIYEAMKRKSPAAMRDISMSTFGEHLAMIGVQKNRGHAFNEYRVVRIP